MMPTILSSDEYRTSLSHIVQRDYFPSLTLGNDPVTIPQSLTEFHRTTTSADTISLDQMQKEKEKSRENMNSMIYKRKRKHSNKKEDDSTCGRSADPTVSSYAVAEFRNALFFPLSTSDATHSSVLESSYREDIAPTTSFPNDRMLPPLPRKTLNIDPAATRFSSPSSPRLGSREIHWEGSTKADDDESSIFTDLDATTVDSYSVQAELRKAKHISRRVPAVIPTFAEPPKETTLLDVTAKVMYRIPPEPSRDLTAEEILKQRRQHLRLQKASRRQKRNISSSKLKPPPRSSSSLRFALRSTYKKPVPMTTRKK